MFRLMRHFSVMCALATATITSVLVLGFYSNENRNLRRLAEDRNVSQAYSFTNVIWPKYASHMAQSAATPADVIKSQAATRELDAEVRQLTRSLPVLMIKIFSLDGLTVYSSDPTQIGESRAKDPVFRAIART